MSRVITVEPAQDGWRMRSGGAEPVVFGDRAEAQWCARKLGEAIAEGGAAADVRILQGDGSLAGRFLFEPAAA